ncbi:MAG: hypothetical protein K8I30_12715, partial [Anaerolineae bacterium]|nr:hypothetical protein [Anaerolineae bacterium]
IVYCGLADVQGPALIVAMGLVLVECVVFALNRFRCPLTKLAQQYGDPNGNDFVADIFLPAWFAPQIPKVFGLLLLFGVILNIWHWLTP